MLPSGSKIQKTASRPRPRTGNPATTNKKNRPESKKEGAVRKSGGTCRHEPSILGKGAKELVERGEIGDANWGDQKNRERNRKPS